MLPRAGGYPQTPFLLLSLAQRKKQRNIHPLQGLPLYGEDATRKVAEADDFSPFWYRGTRDIFFIGWRIVLQDAIIRVSLVYFLIYFLFDCLFEPLSNFIEPLSKGRRKQGCQKRIARPEGAKALRAIQKLCRRAVSARRQLHPFHIGKGLG